MQLRATYIRRVKQSTLVHELGTVICGNWPSGSTASTDIGPSISFSTACGRTCGARSSRRVEGESGWDSTYDYGAAWNWARSLAREERVRLWNELLGLNGFPGGCNGLGDGAR